MNSVTFKEITSKNKKIGIAELNNPKALNALNLSMIDSLHAQLKLWESNDDIAFVILQGAGEKAFCAGGDVVSLYHEIKRIDADHLTDDSMVNGLCGDFFRKEYRLDLYIHEYTKPIVVWGNGYVFGGGMGLFAGASHRVTTENTIMAMPETAIGLYPEVGASWFLNKMPNNIGIFLGITGAFFNASDAKYLGLSNFTVMNTAKESFIEQLSNTEWKNTTEIHQQLDDILLAFEPDSVSTMPHSNVKAHETIITELMNKDNVEDIYSAFLSNTYEQKWLSDAQAKLSAASILSTVLTYQQLLRTKQYSKAECFNAELNLSIRCCQYKEFAEGVRAQLVDKDKQPQWTFKHINEIEPELIDWFFSSITTL